MKVVHLTYALDMGGCERLQVEFARWADRDRFDLRFLSVESLGRSAEIIRNLGYPVASLNKPLGFRPAYFLKLAKILKDQRIDVLHTHDNGPLIYGAIAARLARIPVVVHTRHHGHLPWLEPSKISMARYVSNLVDTVCCVSKDSLVEGIKEGISRKRLKTVWNGIDTNRFNYVAEAAGRSGPLVSVACLRPDKVTESLIRGTALIMKEEPSFCLLLAGDGPPERVEMLKKMAVDCGVAEHVKFLGNVTDVPALLAECCGMVLPSTTEGISLALLEAMACGLPVIATRVGGNPEVVEDGVTGLLVPPNDDRAMAEAMLRMYRDGDMRRGMGIAGRAKVVRDFEIRRMVADYEGLYLANLHEKRKFRSILPAMLAPAMTREALNPKV